MAPNIVCKCPNFTNNLFSILGILLVFLLVVRFFSKIFLPDIWNPLRKAISELPGMGDSSSGESSGGESDSESSGGESSGGESDSESSGGESSGGESSGGESSGGESSGSEGGGGGAGGGDNFGNMWSVGN